MKNLLLLTAIGACALLAGCNREVCRTCPGLTYDFESFDPTIGDDAMTFRRNDGMRFDFTFARNVVTPENEVCSTSVDEEREISCDAIAEYQFRSEELEIDMSINFLELIAGRQGVPDQVILSYSFKGRNFGQFQRTHAVVLEPQIILGDDVVELRDSLTIDGTLYTEVLEIIQPAAAFEPVVDLPDAARFTSIFLKEGVGLLRLVDVDSNVYTREF